MSQIFSSHLLHAFVRKTDRAIDQLCHEIERFAQQSLSHSIPSPSLPLEAAPTETRLNFTYKRKTLENLAQVATHIGNQKRETGSLPLRDDTVQDFRKKNRHDLAGLAAESPYPHLVNTNSRFNDQIPLIYRPRPNPQQQKGQPGTLYYLTTPQKEPWANFAAILKAFTDSDNNGHAPSEPFLKCLYAFYPDFDRHLPAETPTLKTFLKAFAGTFDTHSQPGYIQVLGPINNPDPSLIYLPPPSIYSRHDLERLATLLSLPKKKKPPLNLSPLDLWDLLVDRGDSVPGIHGAGDIQDFLQRFKTTPFYQLDENGRLKTWGKSRHQQRINIIQSTIAVLAGPDGWAPLALTAHLVSRLYPPFRWRTPTTDLITYANNLYAQSFKITSNGFITDTTWANLTYLPANIVPRHEKRVQALKDVVRRQQILANQPGPTVRQTSRLIHATILLIHQAAAILVKPLDTLTDRLTPTPSHPHSGTH